MISRKHANSYNDSLALVMSMKKKTNNLHGRGLTILRFLHRNVPCAFIMRNKLCGKAGKRAISQSRDTRAARAV